MDYIIEKITSLPPFEKILSLTVGVIILFAITTGVSFAAFSFLPAGGEVVFKSPLTEKTETGEAASLSKDIPCPLNGALFSRAEAQLWNSRRPIGVMIENHTEARPQWGLSAADVVYEAVAEGGITRFLAVYFCQDASNIGPVRSARTYYIDWLSEYGENPMYVHIGGANTPGPADALKQIEQLGWVWYNDVDELRGAGFPAIWRGPEKPAPHNAHTATQQILDLAKKRGLTVTDANGKRWDVNFRMWNFKDDTPLADRPASFSAQLTFWAGFDDYAVRWNYDKSANSYKRFNGDVAHVDVLDNKQLTAKVIVIQFMDESHANDGYENNAHLLYDDLGTGPAFIFQDGQATPAQWQKKNRQERTIYLDKKTGQEIKFNRGQIWIETLPTGASIKY